MMLGTFRFLLCNVVLLCHLWIGDPPWSEVGVAAVFGFYILSGYLMTLALNETYGFDRQGIWRYTVNRLLRIYPQYWLVLLIAIAVAFYFKREAFIMNPKLAMPRDLSEWLPNIFIVGMLDGPTRALIPPTWSLDIEVIFYVLMGLALSRSKPIVLVWFFGSVGYTAWLVLTGADFPSRYASYLAASLPFALGAMTYMYRDAFRRYLCLPLWLSATLLVASIVVGRYHILGHPQDFTFYLIIVCIFLVLISLNSIDMKSLPKLWRKADRLLGELAYPIFLLHWHISVLVLYFVFDGNKPSDAKMWLVSIIPIHIVGFFIYYVVDRNVHKLRDRVRGKRLEF